MPVYPPPDLLPALPEIFLVCAAMALLMVGAFRGEGSTRLVSWLAVAALIVTIFLVINTGTERRVALNGLFITDGFAAFMKVLVLIGSAASVVMAMSYNEREKIARFEFPVLILLATTGMLMMISADDLISLYIGLELQSLALYVVAAFKRDTATSSEAGLKYFVLGALSSGMLLYGCSMIYGFSGTTNFEQLAASFAGGEYSIGIIIGIVFVSVGLAFKCAAVPFHMWTPDVYEGAPTPLTAFMAAATKTVALVVTLRLLVTAFPGDAYVWTRALAVIAVCSLVIGNLAALVQKGVKRMLAYSSISHAGFMLIAVASNSSLGARALLYYLVPYAAMSIGSFAVVAARERELGVPVTFANMAGFGWERPLLGISMWTFMLGFAGFPLTGGFVGKFYVFAAAYRHGWTWLVIVGVLATLVSLYYYLGLVRAMFMRRSEDLQLAAGTDARAEPARPLGGATSGAISGGSPPRDALLQTAVVACLVVTVGSFFAVQPLIDVAKHAAVSLPF